MHSGFATRRFAWQDVVALSLLAAGLLFRLVHLGDARFAGDEALLYSLSRQAATLRLFPVYGVNVTGADVWTPGGTYHLLMALPLLFTREPGAAMVFTTLLNVAALAFGYGLLRREYGRTPALVALALAVLNPFAVFFSDRHWNPDVLVPIGFLWIALAAAALRGTGHRPWFWLAFLLVLSPQAHLSCTHLTLVTLLAMAVVRPDVQWRQVAAGIAVGVAFYLPYVGWEAFHGFENTRALSGNLAAGHDAPWYEAFRGLYYMVLYGSGDVTYYAAKGFWFPMTEWDVLGGKDAQYVAEAYGLPGAGGWAIAALQGLAVAGALAATVAMMVGWLIRVVRFGLRAASREDPLTTLAVLNLPLVLGSLLLSRKAFYPHYTIALFPLASVAIARALRDVPPRAVTFAVLPIALAVACGHGVLCSRLYTREESRTSLPVLREATGVILQDAGGSRFALNLAVPRNRTGTWPMHILAREYFEQPFREDGKAPIRYTLQPAGTSAPPRDATRVWEIGSMWLVRRDL